MTRSVVLEVGSEELRAEVRQRGRVVWEATITTSGIGELEQHLRQLPELAEGRSLPRHLLVRLTAPLVQQRTLTDLPPVSARELPGLVAHNAGRFFRQNGHPLITDGVWDGPRGGAVRAAAVEDQVAEQVLHAAGAAGFVLDDIEPLHGPRLSLLPPSERIRRVRAAWRRTALLAGVGALAWLLAFGVAALRLAWEDRGLSRELVRLEAPREALRRVRHEAGDAAQMIQALSEADALRGALATELASVVAALPSEGALQRLNLDREGAGELTGTALGAMALLGKLSARAEVARPAMSGPSVPEAGPTGTFERYTIRLGSRVEP